MRVLSTLEGEGRMIEIAEGDRRLTKVVIESANLAEAGRVNT